MQILNTFLACLFFTLYAAIPLSIGQEIRDTAAQSINLINASFEQIGKSGEALGWGSCHFSQVSQVSQVSQETPPDIQPGAFGCSLLAQQGKFYIGMVARDDGTYAVLHNNLTKPLKAGVCYRISVFLAKSATYNSLSRTTNLPINYNYPLKLTIWGASEKIEQKCTLKPDDWLAESLPIHNDGWRKHTFYIQSPKDVNSLVLSANHVVEKPYNGNLLIDNISSIDPINCTDFRLISGGQKGAFLAMQQISEVISTNASKMVFGKKMPKLTADTEGGRNKSYDQLIAFFEQSESYKLVIRVKEHKELSKQRIAFLYSYIFRFSTLKAQRVEIKQYTPKDEGCFWTFENDELAMSFDSM